MGLDELRRRSRDLLLNIIRSAAERRRVAAAIAEEKIKEGIPIEDPDVEASLWDASVAEALRGEMDERSAGRLTWELVRDALVAEGAIREEPLYPPASYEDVVRLDLDLWEPLAEPGAASSQSLEGAEAELASALGVRPGELVSFPSWRDALRAVLRALAEGVGVVLYEPVHPWIPMAVWEAGGRPYRVHREFGDCWRLRPPSPARRGWVILYEDPDYVTGTSRGDGELSELEESAESARMSLVHLGLCSALSLRDRGPRKDALSIGGVGCALGSLDAGISWVVAPGISDRLRRIRDMMGDLPRPRDVSAASALLSSESLARMRGLVSRRLEYLRSIIAGRLSYCEPSSGPHLFAYGPRQPAWRSGVAVARGLAFGSYPGWFRVNFMVGEEDLRLGLGRLILSLLPRWPA